MSVGHQIGDKSHTIGRSYNSKTNEEVETMDFVNLDEGKYPVLYIVFITASYSNKVYSSMA